MIDKKKLDKIVFQVGFGRGANLEYPVGMQLCMSILSPSQIFKQKSDITNTE